MKDIVHPGSTGELDTALRWVESELTATDPNLQSELAVRIWATGQLVAAIDRCAARHGD